MTLNIEFSGSIGKCVKDEDGKEVGKVVSFLIDSSGQVTEALIENRTTNLLRCPVERLKINQEEISLTTDINKKAEILFEKFPTLQKKMKILKRLSENNEVLPEIYENLCAEFDKALSEMKNETQNLIDDVDKQVKDQEELIKKLHLARTYLEIEHGIGNVKDEIYQQSLISVLKGIKDASYRKANLLKIKDKIAEMLLSGEEPKSETKDKEQKPSTAESGEAKVITVHMTQE